MPDPITARVEPPSRPPLCLWHEPADSSVLDALIREHGYTGLYARHTQPAIKAAKALGYDVPELWQRFPGSKFGRPKVPGASLWDFIVWPGAGKFTEWRDMVRQATMKKIGGLPPLKYVCYFRPPRDLNGDIGAFRNLLSRVRDAEAVCCFEYSNDRFSYDCYALARDHGLLHAFEPILPNGATEAAWGVPEFLHQNHLESLEVWPWFWQYPTKGGRTFYFVQPDEPFVPQWPRAMAAWGFRPVVYTHRMLTAQEK